MNKISLYLVVVILIGVTFEKGSLIELFASTENSLLIKSIIVIYLLLVAIRIAFKPSLPPKCPQKQFAMKISVDGFERDKKFYTEIKLSELYSSREYLELSHKKENQPIMPYEEIKLSDEDE
jgi:hypothetical protein